MHMKGCDGCLTYPQLHSWFWGWELNSSLEQMLGRLLVLLGPELLTKSVTACWFTAHQTYDCLSSPKSERIMGNRAIAFDALQPLNPPFPCWYSLQQSVKSSDSILARWRGAHRDRNPGLWFLWRAPKKKITLLHYSFFMSHNKMFWDLVYISDVRWSSLLTFIYVFYGHTRILSFFPPLPSPFLSSSSSGFLVWWSKPVLTDLVLRATKIPKVKHRQLPLNWYTTILNGLSPQ